MSVGNIGISPRPLPLFPVDRPNYEHVCYDFGVSVLRESQSCFIHLIIPSRPRANSVFTYPRFIQSHELMNTCMTKFLVFGLEARLTQIQLMF